MNKRFNDWGNPVEEDRVVTLNDVEDMIEQINKYLGAIAFRL